MNRKLKNVFVALMMLSVLPILAETDYTTPKEEFRSTWIATVWRLDWPTHVGTSSVIQEVQQEQMVKILDSLAVNNFNAVNFQVRGMCDAMYKSKYEPWSQYVSGTRGTDPGWDPLAFVVEECHKRGMECHAWVNPYRFNTSGASGEGDPTGYYEKGWLITNPKGYRILNPSREDVQDHIVAVCKDIIENYDVDGLLFDDYYYVSAAMDQDATEYAAYTAEGGTQSQADWRRSNVHSLMNKLYTMIQEVSPWVRFGQAPPGGTFQNATRAAAYGIDPCPSGYENCYDSQYIDVMGWLKDGIIDYISPQVYWAIGYSVADYGKMVPWWGTVVNKFNRHLFVSQDISSVTSTDRAGTSALSNSSEILPMMATGGSMTTFGEVEDAVMLNRTSSQNGSFGSIFYSSSSLYSKSATKPITLAHNLKRHLYTLPALPPAMTWKTTTDPGTVKNLSFDGTGTLSWDAMEDAKNKRYTVYAIPNGLNPDNFKKQLKYMLGFTYSNTYEIPEDFCKGYYFGVCVYDRYGNEWEPAIWETTYSETLAAPTLVSPETGFMTDNTFEFKWNAVSGAEKYAVDVALESEFVDIQTVQTAETSLSSDEFYAYINKNKSAYWRVRAVAGGKNDGVSEVRSFEYKMPELTYPIDGATDLDPKVNFTWNVTTEGAPVTLEVASDEKFVNMTFSVESTDGSYQTPMSTLKSLTTYYARLLYNGNYSQVITFSTKAVTVEIPTFKFPLDGGVCYANSVIEVYPQEGVETIVIQVDSNSTFKGTTKCQKKLTDFTFGVAASEIKLNKNREAMVDGTTYYARAYAEYENQNGTTTSTDWSDVISFVYSDKESGIESVSTDTKVNVAGTNVYVTAQDAKVKVVAVSLLGNSYALYDGVNTGDAISLEELPTGFYVLQVVVGSDVHTIKYVKK